MFLFLSSVFHFPLRLVTTNPFVGSAGTTGVGGFFSGDARRCGDRRVVAAGVYVRSPLPDRRSGTTDFFADGVRTELRPNPLREMDGGERSATESDDTSGGLDDA